jgi:hypothetical protein
VFRCGFRAVDGNPPPHVLKGNASMKSFVQVLCLGAVIAFGRARALADMDCCFVPNPPGSWSCLQRNAAGCAMVGGDWAGEDWECTQEGLTYCVQKTAGLGCVATCDSGGELLVNCPAPAASPWGIAVIGMLVLLAGGMVIRNRTPKEAT